MGHDEKLEALKAAYSRSIQHLIEVEHVYETARQASRKAYAELNVYLNKAENSFQDTDAEGF